MIRAGLGARYLSVFPVCLWAVGDKCVEGTVVVEQETVCRTHRVLNIKSVFVDNSDHATVHTPGPLQRYYEAGGVAV